MLQSSYLFGQKSQKRQGMLGLSKGTGGPECSFQKVIRSSSFLYCTAMGFSVHLREGQGSICFVCTVLGFVFTRT